MTLVETPLSLEAENQPPAKPVVVLEHVARRLGPKQVLRDVSFTLPPGQAFGSRKLAHTTLPPSTGTVPQRQAN